MIGGGTGTALTGAGAAVRTLGAGAAFIGAGAATPTLPVRVAGGGAPVRLQPLVCPGPAGVGGPTTGPVVPVLPVIGVEVTSPGFGVTTSSPGLVVTLGASPGFGF